ncbi:MAG: 23S rRNA (pseudouridine(1915)-N(3))-methyltransferase RlmH [Lachnospiraceae bacterium]
MLGITILCVGKIKEASIQSGCGEYVKRLGRYCKLTIIEVPDEKTPDKASEQLNEQIRSTEGQKLLRYIKETDYVIALAINGSMLDSPGLAATMEELPLRGHSNLTYVIGGSLGLSEAVMKRADTSLSFSKMTFPHQLMRLLLLEQLYRAFKIIAHEPYHK